MKRMVMCLMVLVWLLSPMIADDVDTFFEELSYQLRFRGWSEEELGQLQERARIENRVGGEFGDPAMVAYALHHGLYEGEDTSDDVAMLRVRLALALAVEMHTMERLGYGPHEIALGAARTAHEVALQSHQRLMSHEGVPSGSELGNLVRHTIRERISLQTKAMRSGMVGVGAGTGASYGYQHFGPSSHGVSAK